MVPVHVRLLTDAQFVEPLATLESLLKRSRDWKQIPDKLLDVQTEMAAFLVWAQDQQKRIKGELDETARADRRQFNSPGVAVEVCKLLQRITRQIADGIAWRALAYNRPVLRILAMKPHTGHMEMASAVAEFLEAEARVAQTKNVVVINDLTNFLRYGDLTVVGDGGVTIVEVKSHGAAQSGSASRQKQKTRQVLEFIRSGSAPTDQGIKKTVYMRTKPRAYLDDVARIIEMAWKRGAAHERLSDSLAVSAIDVLSMSDRFAAGAKMADIHPWNPFRQSRDAGVFDTLRISRQFSPNVAPYSIFPFPVEDRLAIMTGKVWIVSFFNFGNLIRCLRRRGLLVTPPSADWYKMNAELPPGELGRRELENPFVVGWPKDDKVLKIPFSTLARLYYEFLDEDSFADAVEEELALDFHEPTLLHYGYAFES